MTRDPSDTSINQSSTEGLSLIGEGVGLAEGLLLGDVDGVANGVFDGLALGVAEGLLLRDVDGAADGFFEGLELGVAEGLLLGEGDGGADGAFEGLTLGVTEGFLLGTAVLIGTVTEQGGPGMPRVMATYILPGTFWLPLVLVQASTWSIFCVSSKLSIAKIAPVGTRPSW